MNTIDKFLSEHLQSEFQKVDPPKLVISAKWKHDYIVRSRNGWIKRCSNTWQYDNKFVPIFVPDNLKWFERDLLETWSRKNKCDEFLKDTDSHFKSRHIVNFDMITNDEE